MSKYIYPFWETGKSSETPPKAKLPKIFRKRASFGVRALQSIIKDRKTGKFLKRT